MTADMRKFVGMMLIRKRGKSMSWGEEQQKEIETIRERIIENMRPQTIAQYHIKQWLDDNFIMGCARLEYTGKDTAKVMDTVGGVMYVEYKNGEVRECQK
jgi:exoribonuclease II